MRRWQSVTKMGVLIVILGALFYCYEYFLRVSPSVMKDNLMEYFHFDATMFGALSAYYFYAYTPLQLIAGVLVDRYRVRHVLVTAVLICAGGAALFGLAPNYAVAAFGRFLQGVGSAFAFVGALKLVAMWLPENRFAFAAGTINFAGFFGAGMSQILLTKMTDWLGWQHTLVVLAVLGVFLAGGILLTLRIKQVPMHGQLGQRKHATFAHSLKALWDAMKNRAIWLAGIYAGLTFLPTSVFAALWGIPYIEVLHHYSPTKAASAISAIFVGWAVGAVLSGALSDWLGTRVWLMRIGALLACLLSILLIYDSLLPYFLVVGLFALFGIFSAVQPLAFVIARDQTRSARNVGGAIAFVNMLTMLGGLIFQRGVGKIMDAEGGTHIVHGVATYSLMQYQHALIIIPVSLGLGVIVAFFIRDKIPLKTKH